MPRTWEGEEGVWQLEQHQTWSTAPVNGPSSLQETVLPTVSLRDLLQRIMDGNLLTITKLFKMSLKK